MHLDGGLGTQRFEEEVRSKFPKFLFADGFDMMQRPNAHIGLDRFRSGEVKICGNTDTANGLDFPNVTLVEDRRRYRLHFPD